MPIKYNSGIIAGQQYPTWGMDNIGTEIPAKIEKLDSIKLTRAVSGKVTVRSGTAPIASFPQFSISHTVTNEQKELLEEHYAVNKSEFFRLDASQFGYEYGSKLVKYTKPPTCTMLGGNYWKVENTLVETIDRTTTNPPVTYPVSSGSGFGVDNAYLSPSTTEMIYSEGNDWVPFYYPNWPPVPQNYKAVTFKAEATPTDIAVVELFGATYVETGQWYFEVEVPYGCNDIQVGIVIGDVPPVGHTTSVYDLTEYHTLTFSTNTGGSKLSSSGNVSFTTPWTALFLNPNDVIAFEFDCTIGRIDRIYINGVLQSNNTDINYISGNQWTPYSKVRPFVKMANSYSSYGPIPATMEQCYARLNTAQEDFMYYSPFGYGDLDYKAFGSPRNDTPAWYEYIDLFVSGSTYTLPSLQVETPTPVWFWLNYLDGNSTLSTTVSVTINTTNSIATVGGLEAYTVIGLYNSIGVCIASNTSNPESNQLVFTIHNGVDYYLALKAYNGGIDAIFQNNFNAFDIERTQ